MPLGTEIGLVPGHIVLDRDSAPPRGTAAPTFLLVSIVNVVEHDSQEELLRHGNLVLKAVHNDG